MASSNPDEDSVRLAKSLLGRVERETTGVADSALARAADHFSAKDAKTDGVGGDLIEIWGRRIGRALGFVFLLVLIVHLFTRWLS